MAVLYSYQGQEPQELPGRIRLSDGTTRTNSSTFTEEEIADAGFTGPYTKPEYNSEIENLEWDSESKEWIITQFPEEIFWKSLRNQRNFKLLTSDWTQLPDSSLTSSKKSNWATYRQELRDLPSNIEDPKNFIWPIQPE